MIAYLLSLFVALCYIVCSVPLLYWLGSTVALLVKTVCWCWSEFKAVTIGVITCYLIALGTIPEAASIILCFSISIYVMSGGIAAIIWAIQYHKIVFCWLKKQNRLWVILVCCVLVDVVAEVCRHLNG